MTLTNCRSLIRKGLFVVKSMLNNIMATFSPFNLCGSKDSNMVYSQDCGFHEYQMVFITCVLGSFIVFYALW